MRLVTTARFALFFLFLPGLSTDLSAQEGPRAPITIEHRVSVVVPVILSLVPPDPASPDQGWRVRTNDPTLRRRLRIGVLPTDEAGDTLQVTIVSP